MAVFVDPCKAPRLIDILIVVDDQNIVSMPGTARHTAHSHTDCITVLQLIHIHCSKINTAGARYSRYGWSLQSTTDTPKIKN